MNHPHGCPFQLFPLKLSKFVSRNSQGGQGERLKSVLYWFDSDLRHIFTEALDLFTKLIFGFSSVII